jgi:hypothetical protein
MKVDLTKEEIDWILCLSSNAADNYQYKLRRPNRYDFEMAKNGMELSLDVYNKLKSI